MTSKHHLLIIGSVWPEPKSSASGVRMMQLIHLFLGQGWKITFCSDANVSDFMFNLESIGIDKFYIELNSDSFNDFLKSIEPSIVLFDRYITEEKYGWRVAENKPKALRILDTEDLHCLRYARQFAFKKGRDIEDSDLYSDYAKREIASIMRSDISLIISEFEMEILKEKFNVPQQQIYYLPFLLKSIDKPYLSLLPTYEERKDFIFIGNFLHEPNWDAVQYLKTEIWPKIHSQLPNVSLNIFGAYPTEKVLQLNSPKSSFFIKGRAEDVFTEMKNARICLAPLRFGAGIKGKLIDAMICGTPSITTKIGAEGINNTFSWPGTIADNPNDFVKAAINYYLNKELWIAAQKNGIGVINNRFNSKLFKTKFLEKITEKINNLEYFRAKNFMGAMLLYQTANATKYMSKWIQEKNNK